jgi:hypothetical protein
MAGANGLSRPGIEHYEVKLARGTDRGDQLLQRHRLGLGILVHGEPGVDRHQIVDPADLQAVAGVIHHRPVRFFGIARKPTQRLEESVAGQVVGKRHFLKSDPAQGVGNQLGIARRIGKLRRVLVGTVADDERDALGRRGPRGSLRRQRREPLARLLACGCDFVIVIRRQGKTGRSIVGARLSQIVLSLEQFAPALMGAHMIGIEGEHEIEVFQRGVQISLGQIDFAAARQRILVLRHLLEHAVASASALSNWPIAV